MLLTCHAGCSVEAITEALGGGLADLFDDGSNGHYDEQAIYPYVDEDGRPLYEVVRFPGKRFAQRLPDGTWGLNGARRVLYRLPRVLEAVRSGERIYIVEGEKDVHALERLGHVATCNPGGAGKWRDEYSEALRGAKVTVVADRDEPGYDHVRQVAGSLQGVAAEVEALEPTKGKDISEHLANGGTVAELVGVPGATVPPALGEVAPGTALQSGKFRVLDVAKMVGETPPPVPWEIDGLAVRGDVTVLTGDPGAGKSLLALTLAGAVARGESIAGIECSKGTALYVDVENGGREVHRRLHSLGIPIEGVTVVAADGVNIRDDGDRAELESLVACFGPSLLVLDSLTALWPGANERKTEDVAPTLYALKRLAERHEVCGFFKCDEPAIAAVPIQTPEDIGVWWLCEQHADILPWHEGIGGRHDAPTVYNISRTCRYNSLGPDNPPCGAAADYLAVTLFRDADVPYLATVSLCERHASGLVGQ